MEVLYAESEKSKDPYRIYMSDTSEQQACMQQSFSMLYVLVMLTPYHLTRTLTIQSVTCNTIFYFNLPATVLHDTSYQQHDNT